MSRVLPKIGDWIKVNPKNNTAKIRTDINGNFWQVRALDRDKILLQSAERTFGSRNHKSFDGMWIWTDEDPNYEWL